MNSFDLEEMMRLCFQGSLSAASHLRQEDWHLDGLSRVNMEQKVTAEEVAATTPWRFDPWRDVYRCRALAPGAA